MIKPNLVILSICLTSSLFASEENVVNTLKFEKFSDPIESEPRVKSFSVSVKHTAAFYSFMNGRASYTSNMLAKIETYSPRDLQEYAIVQFIRGCHYNSSKLQDGTFKYNLRQSRIFFGKYIDIKHKDWVIDSSTTDPIYWNGTSAENGKDYGRTGLYRLDNPRETPRSANGRIFYKHHTNETAYYVSDSPTGASFDDGILGSSNASMEFKTCLVKHKDIPKSVDPSGKSIKSKLIKCFYWQNNHQYNYELEKYEMPKSIHPFCTN